MIQRIQTIFLFLAAIAFGLLFAVPFAKSDTVSAGFMADGLYNIYDHIALMALTVLGCLLAMITIFLYKNRKTQRKLVYGIIILGILLPVAAFLLFTNDAPNMFSAGTVNDQFGLFIPLASIIFGVLANHYIRKDDKLVQSMDRLR